MGHLTTKQQNNVLNPARIKAFQWNVPHTQRERERERERERQRETEREIQREIQRE